MASRPVIGGGGPNAPLLNPPADITRGEADIRLEDYLNDKIQTTADFANLPSLVASVEIQRMQLEEQFEDAKNMLEAAKKASENHSAHILEEAQAFEKQQASVQKRLMQVTLSDTPEEAMARLKGPMEKLRRVELAKSYVELLKDVDDLAKDARRHLPKNPKEALKPYTQLKEVAILLRNLHEPAEHAGIHLVTYVQAKSERLWAEMKKIMSDDFESVLKEAKWPEEAKEPTREWCDSFERLLDLQEPELLASKEPLVLLPMSVLAKSYVQQFRYHFFSDKPTNHPQKLGDYFFPWFVGIIETRQEYFKEHVTCILAAHFRGTALAGVRSYIDPVSAFITALLPVLKEKVDSVITTVANEPQLLSRFVAQLLDFDDSLRQLFDYDAGNAEYGWKGLAWDVLDTWFERWLKAEKTFAFERYQEIIRSPESGQIDYDSAGPGKTKATQGALQVTDLLGSVTRQYRLLRRFPHMLQFLIEIQAEMLDQYHGRLKDSLDLYLTLTSPIARTLHGISPEQQSAVEGIKGIESLCKVFGSADHVISTLKEWSNNEFFVDLWAELQSTAKNTYSTENIAGTMTVTDVKGATSDAVGSEDEGSVFDVTINEFAVLRNRAENLIIEAVKNNLAVNFKQYLSKPEWTTVGEPDLSVLAVTPELDQPLRSLREEMEFTHRTLAYPSFRRIWRQGFEALQGLLWIEVLLRQDFTTLGAARFLQDFIAIQNLSDSVSEGRVFYLPRLKEGILFLNLPLEAKDDVRGAMTLAEASRAIYASNQEADEVLHKLGFTHLSRADARSILQRRVEASD